MAILISRCVEFWSNKARIPGVDMDQNIHVIVGKTVIQYHIYFRKEHFDHMLLYSYYF